MCAEPLANRKWARPNKIAKTIDSKFLQLNFFATIKKEKPAKQCPKSKIILCEKYKLVTFAKVPIKKKIISSVIGKSLQFAVKGAFNS